jgi:hypothetical protein
MRNRYFSIENASLINENEDKAKESENNNDKISDTDTPVPNNNNERLDFILKKLYQSRNLPGNNELTTSESSTDIISLSSTNVAASLTSKPAPKPDRKHEFGDEFIPLSKAVPDPTPKQKQQENLQDFYKGPYDVKSIQKVRRFLLDEFVNSYYDRQTEILKMKMSMKSRFNDDKKLWRKIKQNTTMVRKRLSERLTAFSHFKSKSFNSSTPSHKRFKYDDDYDESDEDSTSNKCKNNKKVKYIELNDTEESGDMDSENEKSVIRMINSFKGPNLEELEKFAGSSSSSLSEDEDSKCMQYGKYSTSSSSSNKVDNNKKQTSNKKSEKKNTKLDQNK